MESTMQSTTLVINVTDGVTYDAAFQHHKSEYREVVTISACDLYELYHKLINLMRRIDNTENQSFVNSVNSVNNVNSVNGVNSVNLSESQPLWITVDDSLPPVLETSETKRKRSLERIRTCIDRIGYVNTTLNMECCSCYDLTISLTLCSKQSDQYVFIDKNTSEQVIDFMVYMLSKGSQVICADFALKALISNWNPDKFGAQCPVEQVGHVQGDLYVRYNIDACKESCFPQLKTVAQLAIPDNKNTLKIFDHCDSMAEHSEGKKHSEDSSVSSMSMDAMGKTIVYRVLDSIDTNLSVKVMSVAVGKVKTILGTDNMNVDYYQTCDSNNSQRDLMCLEGIILEDDPLGIPPLVRQNSGEMVLPPFQPFGTKRSLANNIIDHNMQSTIKKTIEPFDMKNYDQCCATAYGIDSTIKGLPVHTIVTFINMPGTLVMSSLHLTNLTAVNTNLKNVVETATNILGRQRSAQMEQQLKQAEKYGMVALTRTISNCVTEIATSSYICTQNDQM